MNVVHANRRDYVFRIYRRTVSDVYCELSKIGKDANWDVVLKSIENDMEIYRISPSRVFSYAQTRAMDLLIDYELRKDKIISLVNKKANVRQESHYG